MTDTEGDTNSQGLRAYVLVNNCSERNAPLTVEGRVGMLCGYGRFATDSPQAVQ